MPEFLDSHHSDYEDYWLMECDDVKVGRNTSTFSTDVLYPPSDWKSKMIIIIYT
jgi:hypothetical protein